MNSQDPREKSGLKSRRSLRGRRINYFDDDPRSQEKHKTKINYEIHLRSEADRHIRKQMEKLDPNRSWFWRR